MEFRDHRASREARERLRDFERLAIESEPRDAYKFIRRVGREVNRGFRAAVEELAPSLPEELAKQVLLNGVATASVVGAPADRAPWPKAKARRTRKAEPGLGSVATSRSPALSSFIE